MVYAKGTVSENPEQNIPCMSEEWIVMSFYHRVSTSSRMLAEDVWNKSLWGGQRIELLIQV